MTEPVIRLFISSPSDVSAERRRAALVVDRLNGEFAGRVRIEPILWEEHFYSSHAGFQGQIAETATCDIVIAIFGGRLGTRLPDTFPRQPVTGEPYPSGTAYEVLSAIEARKAGQDLPDIYVFRFPQSPAVQVDAPNRADVEAQWNALKSFFETWFHHSGGEFVAAFHEYSSTDDFAMQAEKCLRDFLARHDFVTQGPVWDRLTLGSPFPGLSAFEANRRTVFFGRERAISQALDRLRAAGSEVGRLPFLLVIGASGTGKSSLLRAGLMPRLTTPGTIPDVDLWRSAVITPGRDPFLSLAEGLFSALGTELRAGAFTSAAMLARQLAADPYLAIAPVRAALAVAAQARMVQAGFDGVQPARLALAVDQAERLFTETDPDVALAFASLLVRLVEGGLAYVILGLRSDTYARFQAMPPLLALREAGATFDLVPPTANELEAIIAGPVEACNPALAFEPGLAARLAADAEGGDALPLLQITLGRLYDVQAARGDGVLRGGDYLGMGEAVTSTAQEALAGLAPAAVDALPALVAAMVNDVTTDPVTGRPMASIVPLDRVTFELARPDRVQLLDAFIGSRLLTADGDGARIVVRPTHEALLRIWPRAVNLVSELGPMLRVRRALAALVRDWQAADEADKPRHLEISPALLEGALQLVTRLDVDAAMTAFVAACTAEAEARRRQVMEEQERRLRDAEALAAARRRTTQGAIVGLVVALALAGVAGWQWRMAGVQRDRAEQALASATEAANSLVFNLAQKFRHAGNVPVAVVKDILDRASQLQARLLGLGSPSEALRRSQAEALLEMSATLLEQGRTQDALGAATQARGILQSVVDGQPTNMVWQAELWLSFVRVGDVLVVQGNLPEALKSYQASQSIANRLVQADPDNAGWQHDLSVSFEKVADVLRAQGNLPEALKLYQAGQAIAGRLAKADPGNSDWQHDLSVKISEVADVLVAQGNLPEALKSYQAALAIADRLAKADPDNAVRQRELSVPFNKIGSVLLAQGNPPEALKSYQAGQTILDRLAKTDPGNAGWQHDLSVLTSFVGDVFVAQNNLPEALNSYQASLAIADRLAQADPGNAGWQHDLSASFNKVGSVFVAQGNLPEALKSHQASLAILDRLAKADPGNTHWQRDLSVSLISVGSVLAAQNNLPEALKSYRAGQTILDRLAKTDPGNAGWQHDLSVSFEKVSNVYVAQGNLPEALKSCQTSLAIADRLAKIDPGNTGWQRELSLSYAYLGFVQKKMGRQADAGTAWASGRAIITQLLKISPDQFQWKQDLAWYDRAIASLDH